MRWRCGFSQEAATKNEDAAELMMFDSDIASIYLAIGDRARAEPFARASLVRAVKARHEVLAALAMAYLAVVQSEYDRRRAALLIGHALQRLEAVDWELVPPDTTTFAQLQAQLSRALDVAEFARLQRREPHGATTKPSLTRSRSSRLSAQSPDECLRCLCT